MIKTEVIKTCIDKPSRYSDPFRNITLRVLKFFGNSIPKYLSSV